MIPSYRYKALIDRLRLIAEAEREMAELWHKGDPTKPLAPEFRAAISELSEATAGMLDRIADELTALTRPH